MNLPSIIILIIISLTFIYALVKTIKSKGKCSCCKEDCPYKKKK